MWLVGHHRDQERRAMTHDMMGPSNLPDPYSTTFISREVPGLFVQFDDQDTLDEIPQTSPRDPYDDLSREPEEFGSRRGTRYGSGRGIEDAYGYATY